MPSGSNNFLQWNPAAINQQTDGTYSVDAMRTGGAVTGIFPADLANKLFYQCSTMVAAFGEALSNKGYNMSDADISALITALSNVLTKADFGTSAGTVCQGNDGRFIPTGTKMWFYQNTAPFGWVIDVTPSDAVLAVKGGSNAYNVNGGMQAGTWSQPTHTHTGPSHTHSILSHTHDFSAGTHSHVGNVGDTTLITDQIPSHSHSLIYTAPGDGGGSYASSTGDTGGGGSHTHAGGGGTATVSGTTDGSNTENTGTSGTGATGASASATTWRPLAQVGIICVKS